ncbi:hypothetical protein ASE48_03745 [Mycobacterium sp. Root265]|uniref:hypothetical protein n=1 Tax=Mycobacterium sp. Root265 TaxID=1736504 RepID=UPI0007088DC1|nr:hypothetical protein [Mycobacterium sp. Root265]KRD14144.1 hypothetical protein ASE48_03745 [Mycobacterium sp. Root265]
MTPFVGSEAIAHRAVTPGILRSQYTRILPNIYVLKGTELDLEVRAHAAWLWCGRTGVVAGRAAAGLYLTPGAVTADLIELIALKSKHPPDLIVRNERIAVDEISVRENLPVTSPARTALDLARYLERDAAVAILDPLTAATGITKDDIWRLADRYRGARGIRNAVPAILQIDSGAASPEETRVRLLLSDAGLRPTHSQIRITDGFEETVIAMGWPDLKVGVNCDRFATRGRHAAEMAEFLQSQDWLTVHALPGHSDGSIVWRTRNAVWSRLRRRPAAPR